MSADLLKRLSIGLAVLVVAWIAYEAVGAGIESGSVEFALLAEEGEPPDSIVIERPDGAVRFAPGPTGWLVNGYQADSATIDQLLEALAAEPRADLVARNPATHNRFDLDSSSARRLRVYRNGTPAVDIVVGKRGQDFESVYLKHPDDDEVYLVRTQMITHVDRMPDDWRDKRIVDIEGDNVATVDVVRGGSAYSVQRNADTTWSIDNAPADSAAITRMLREYDDLRAVGFPRPEQTDSIDFDPPDRRAVLRDGAGSALVELVFDSMSTGYWVRRTGDSTVFRLDRFRVDRLVPADSTLRRETS